MDETPCFSCGARVPAIEGPVHRYMDSSPGCWWAFGQISAREYSDLAYAAKHRLTVDAYAVQHPGSESPQSVRSVALHLISLWAVIEQGVSLEQATVLLQRLGTSRPEFRWLEPPLRLGEVTVRDVLDAGDAPSHVRAVEQWAQSAWHAWHEHHDQVRLWGGEAF